MGVRVKLKIVSRSGKEVITSALANSGFEAETSQLLIPRSLARELDLWPPPPDAHLVEVGTAGGPVRNYLIPKTLDVYVLAGDRTVGPIKCDAMISLIEYEVLISDVLIEELGVVLLAPKTGLWRFKDEDRVRVSEAPQYWF
uniref:Uncharacterized protein n=1 Tax=Ignisphaera aggregans TaxID=334771 RepID=A0A7J2U712_9CREN